MISYTLYQKNPASHYIYIDLEIDSVSGGRLLLQLPSWRPGRYELGNFAKNIKKVDAFGSDGNPLPYVKRTKDLWQIETKGNSAIKVTYSYFAAELNAGSCYADTEQVYVNPVHCCMYVPDRMNETHRVVLKLPGNYRVACALPVKNKTLEASSFDQLADSPFIASPTLQTFSYTVREHKFHLHFQGVCKPEKEKLLRDFSRFTEQQLTFWGDFPVKEYHFLFEITPQRFYHGVEHTESTVIALGPGYAINSGSTYEDLLGVSSHELFHTWNVKTIRPAEMLPYDFSRENYADTGYVYEGFTTYYGDKMLFASGVFDAPQYFATLQERLQKHFHNYGRYNLSVAQSSRDTWLDGYIPGAPYRKTSIYDEGCLVAFMIDVFILRETGNQRSLRDVCRLLCESFGKKGKGYTDADIRHAVHEVAGVSADPFFASHVHAPADYIPTLEACFSYLGITFAIKPAAAVCERLHGFRVTENPTTKITLVAPYSPAWKAGLFAGDEIIAVNGMAVRGNLNSWLAYFAEEGSVAIDFISDDRLRRCQLEPGKKGQTWFGVPAVSIAEEQDDRQKAAFGAWLRT